MKKKDKIIVNNSHNYSSEEIEKQYFLRGLRLDEKEALEESPMHRDCTTKDPLLLAYGTNEPSEMKRQSVSLYNKFSISRSSVILFPIENCDHFDTVDTIGNSSSILFKKIINNIKK